MGMRAGGGGGDDLNSEINVTPMVDIMLVLLIIFMITAPMMNNAVGLEMPKVSATKIESPDGKLILTIDTARKLKLNSAPILWKDLKVKLSAIQDVKHEKEMFIQADKNLPYEVVVTAMALAQSAGIPKVQLMTVAGDELSVEQLDAPLPSTPTPAPAPH